MKSRTLLVDFPSEMFISTVWKLLSSSCLSALPSQSLTTRRFSLSTLKPKLSYTIGSRMKGGLDVQGGSCLKSPVPEQMDSAQMCKKRATHGYIQSSGRIRPDADRRCCPAVDHWVCAFVVLWRRPPEPFANSRYRSSTPRPAIGSASQELQGPSCCQASQSPVLSGTQSRTRIKRGSLWRRC